MRKHKKSNPIVDERVAALAGLISKLKRGSGGKVIGRVPVEMRSEAVSLLRETGLSLREFGSQIGIGCQTLCSWRQASGVKKSSKRKKRFREVRILPEKALVRAVPKARSFELALARGARITGLNLEDVAQLLSVQVGAR